MYEKYFPVAHFSYLFTARLEAQRCQVTPYVLNFLVVVFGVTDSFKFVFLGHFIR